MWSHRARGWWPCRVGGWTQPASPGGASIGAVKPRITAAWIGAVKYVIDEMHPVQRTVYIIRVVRLSGHDDAGVRVGPVDGWTHRMYYLKAQSVSLKKRPKDGIVMEIYD